MAAQFVEQNLHAIIQNINPILHASFNNTNSNAKSEIHNYFGELNVLTISSKNGNHDFNK